MFGGLLLNHENHFLLGYTVTEVKICQHNEYIKNLDSSTPRTFHSYLQEYCYLKLLYHIFVAFRIHISQNTKTRLDELGSYKMEYRGEVELKVVSFIAVV